MLCCEKLSMKVASELCFLFFQGIYPVAPHISIWIVCTQIIAQFLVLLRMQMRVSLQLYKVMQRSEKFSEKTPNPYDSLKYSVYLEHSVYNTDGWPFASSSCYYVAVVDWDRAHNQRVSIFFFRSHNFHFSIVLLAHIVSVFKLFRWYIAAKISKSISITYNFNFKSVQTREGNRLIPKLMNGFTFWLWLYARHFSIALYGSSPSTVLFSIVDGVLCTVCLFQRMYVWACSVHHLPFTINRYIVFRWILIIVCVIHAVRTS